MPQLILLDTMPPRDGDHSYWREMRESLAYLCVLQIMGRAEIHPWKNRSQRTHVVELQRSELCRQHQLHEEVRIWCGVNISDFTLLYFTPMKADMLAV